MAIDEHGSALIEARIRGRVRPVHPNDLPALKAVIDAAGLFPSDLLDGMIADYLAAPPGEEGEDLWLTFDDDGPVAIVYCAPEAMTAGTWNLFLIAVAPSHRGTGVGRTLVRYVESVLPAAGARILLIETSGLPEFARTRRFYARLGYVEEARIRGFYREGEDKVIFRKELPAAS